MGDVRSETAVTGQEAMAGCQPPVLPTSLSPNFLINLSKNIPGDAHNSKIT